VTATHTITLTGNVARGTGSGNNVSSALPAIKRNVRITGSASYYLNFNNTSSAYGFGFKLGSATNTQGITNPSLYLQNVRVYMGSYSGASSNTHYLIQNESSGSIKAWNVTIDGLTHTAASSTTTATETTAGLMNAPDSYLTITGNSIWNTSRDISIQASKVTANVASWTQLRYAISSINKTTDNSTEHTINLTANITRGSDNSQLPEISRSLKIQSSASTRYKIDFGNTINNTSSANNRHGFVLANRTMYSPTFTLANVDVTMGDYNSGSGVVDNHYLVRSLNTSTNTNNWKVYLENVKDVTTSGSTSAGLFKGQYNQLTLTGDMVWTSTHSAKIVSSRMLVNVDSWARLTTAINLINYTVENANVHEINLTGNISRGTGANIPTINRQVKILQSNYTIDFEVNSWDLLYTAILLTNLKEDSAVAHTIRLTGNVTRGTGQKLPEINRSITFEGNGNTVNFSNTSGNIGAGFILATRKTLSPQVNVKNLTVIMGNLASNPNQEALSNHYFIRHTDAGITATSAGTDTGTATGGQYWTVSLYNVSHQGNSTAGLFRSQNSILKIPGGTINWVTTHAFNSTVETLPGTTGSGTNTRPSTYTAVSSSAGVIVARGVEITNSAVVNIEGTYTLIRIRPSDIRYDTFFRIDNSTVTLASSYTHAIWAGSHTSSEQITDLFNPLSFEVNGQSAVLKASGGHGQIGTGTAQDSEHGHAVIALNGRQTTVTPAIKITNGATVKASSGENNPNERSLPAFIASVRNGVVEVSNQSLLEATSNGNNNNYGAALRLRGVGYQTFNLDNATLRVVRRPSVSAAPAMRFYNFANAFNVTNGGQLYVHNNNNVTPTQGAATSRDGGNQGIQYVTASGGNTSNKSSFSVSCPESERDCGSKVEIIAQSGAAITMDHTATIELLYGAEFVARGRSATADYAIFDAPIVTFTTRYPGFYDFENMRGQQTRHGFTGARGGRVFNVENNSSYYSFGATFAAWQLGTDHYYAPMVALPAVAEFRLTGVNFGRIDSVTSEYQSYFTAALDTLSVVGGNQKLANASRISGFDKETPTVQLDLGVPTNANTQVAGNIVFEQGLNEYRPLYKETATVIVSIKDVTGTQVFTQTYEPAVEKAGQFAIALPVDSNFCFRQSNAGCFLPHGYTVQVEASLVNALGQTVEIGKVTETVRDVTPPRPVKVDLAASTVTVNGGTVRVTPSTISDSHPPTAVRLKIRDTSEWIKMTEDIGAFYHVFPEGVLHKGDVIGIYASNEVNDTEWYRVAINPLVHQKIGGRANNINPTNQVTFGQAIFEPRAQIVVGDGALSLIVPNFDFGSHPSGFFKDESFIGKTVNGGTLQVIDTRENPGWTLTAAISTAFKRKQDEVGLDLQLAYYIQNREQQQVGNTLTFTGKEKITNLSESWNMDEAGLALRAENQFILAGNYQGVITWNLKSGMPNEGGQSQ